MEKTGTPSINAAEMLEYSKKYDEYNEQKEIVKSIKFLLEQRENEYYEAQSKYRETQIRYDKAVIKLNWLREELESSRSV